MSRLDWPHLNYFLVFAHAHTCLQVVGTVEDIIAYEMVGYCAAMVLEFMAFVRLRMTHPDIKRPFKTPGGLGASICLVLPATLFTVAIMVLSHWSVWVAGGVQVVFAVGFGLLCKRLRRTHPDYFLISPETSAINRLMPGRRMPDEVHQSLLAQEKEDAESQRESPTMSPSVLEFDGAGPVRSQYIETSTAESESASRVHTTSESDC
jgi:hypothetical protein